MVTFMFFVTWILETTTSVTIGLYAFGFLLDCVCLVVGTAIENFFEKRKRRKKRK